MPPEESNLEKRTKVATLVLAALPAVVLAVVPPVLYLLGLVEHEAFLHYFGLNNGLLYPPFEHILAGGYRTLTDILATYFLRWLQWLVLLVFFLAVAILAVRAFILKPSQVTSAKSPPPSSNVEGSSIPLLLVAPLFVYAGYVLTVLIFLMFTLMPTLATKVGRDRARDLHDRLRSAKVDTTQHFSRFSRIYLSAENSDTITKSVDLPVDGGVILCASGYCALYAGVGIKLIPISSLDSLVVHQIKTAAHAGSAPAGRP